VRVVRAVRPQTSWRPSRLLPFDVARSRRKRAGAVPSRLDRAHVVAHVASAFVRGRVRRVIALVRAATEQTPRRTSRPCVTARSACSRLPSDLPGAFAKTWSLTVRLTCSATVLDCVTQPRAWHPNVVCEQLAWDEHRVRVARLGRASRASDSSRPNREAPGRSEGRGPRRVRVVRAVRPQTSWRPSRLRPFDVARSRRKREAPCLRASTEHTSWRTSRLRSFEDGPTRDHSGSRREAADAEAHVASVRDRDVRVLATPLGPAGRIREDVVARCEAHVLGDRAWSRRSRLGAWPRFV
jgi:hypothetical protein